MKNAAGTGFTGWALSICLCLSQWMSAQNSIIKGRIYDAQTFEDVSHVNILIRNHQGEVITSITSGYNGKYSTDSIEPGVYRIEVYGREFEKMVVNNLVAQESRVALFDIPLERKKVEVAKKEGSGSSDIIEMLGGIVKNAALKGF